MANLKVPQGFSPVADISLSQKDTLRDVIGVVTDISGPNPTKGRDWMVTLNIQDQSMLAHDDSSKGLMIRIFQPQERMPFVEVGDIVILQKFKVNVFSNMPVLISGRSMSMSMAVILSQEIPLPAYKVSYASGQARLKCRPVWCHKDPSPAEQLYAIDLKHALDGQIPSAAVAVHGVSPQTATPVSIAPTIGVSVKSKTGGMPLKRKFSLIQDVEIDRFYDIVVEVVKMFDSREGYMDMYVTDYTSHKELYDYPDPDETVDGQGREGDTYSYIKSARNDWPGPWGQQSLHVEVYEPHAKRARDTISESHLVEMRNVRMKMGRSGRLEGNLFPDRHWPKKCLLDSVQGSKSEAITQLGERKRQYYEARGRPANKESKRSKKVKRKQAMRDKQKPATNDVLTNVPGIDQSAAVGVNKHVKCSHPMIQTSTLTDLLTSRGTYRSADGTDVPLPFLNQKRRLKVRCLDFFPPTLFDFAINNDIPASQETESTDLYASASQPKSQSWRWDFFLLLEDASTSAPNRTGTDEAEKPSQWLHVTHEAAEFLFQLDATDLRGDEENLAALREKMAILWGNLEELKSEGKSLDEVSNLPFECCAAEYGQEVDVEDREEADREEWIRCFAMFGVTVHEEVYNQVKAQDV